MRTKVKREFIGDGFGMLVVCSVLVIFPLNREENLKNLVAYTENSLRANQATSGWSYCIAN